MSHLFILPAYCEFSRFGAEVVVKIVTEFNYYLFLTALTVFAAIKSDL